ncbi:acyl-CoA carboxylase subunit epsilon [Tessaracoccus defluvii]|uniref:acyl-CoA carboxylase subunit epsilon n=1 Tax=Tessaracoccus defluvii TaxID=1285901 RepID=UPI001D04F175|nr:acyl-CoA carboxylase subunit epsilon [Tessaracoccus defluvii]
MTEPLSFAKAHLTEEEIAAVTVVLTVATRPEKLRSADDRPLAGGWKSYYRTMRAQLMPGRDAWRTYHRG